MNEISGKHIRLSKGYLENIKHHFFKKIIWKYIKRYKDYEGKQISLFYRFGLFFRNKRFYSKPLLALGVIFLKTLEYISAGIGCVVGRIKVLTYIFSLISILFNKMFLKIREKRVNTKGAILILKR